MASLGANREMHGNGGMQGHPLGVQPEHFRSLLGDENSTRKKGLGSMHCLEDEVLLQILDVLSPQELGQLACVSKALYCFANHEDVWKGIVLQCEDVAQWVYHEMGWKATYVMSVLGKKEFSQHGIRVRHMYSDVLYQPWMCARLDVDEAWLETENIDRRSGLRVEEFIEEYEASNKPVILTDVASAWPACRTWNREYFERVFGDKDVIVGDTPMKFSSYVQYCDRQRDEYPLYLFDKTFCETVSELESAYSVPEYFQEDLFSVLGEDARPDYRWLIYGPYKSGSTFHKDPNATSAWNAVIFGAKKWIMYPPHVLPPGVRQSEDGADVASPVSLMEWMLSFYDLRDCEGVKPLECVLRKGEVLFVPKGWWHMALNVEETCAITQNYVSQRNLRHVLDFLHSPHANVLVSGVKTEEEKTSLYTRFLQALEEKNPSVLGVLDEESRKKRHKSEIQVWVDYCVDTSLLLCMIFL